MPNTTLWQVWSECKCMQDAGTLPQNLSREFRSVHSRKYQRTVLKRCILIIGANHQFATMALVATERVHLRTFEFIMCRARFGSS